MLAGRGKKNNKSLDLILAGLFVLVCRESPQGSDVLLVANDADQAAQDLDLAKKIVIANGLNDPFDGELIIFEDEIRRRDGRGTMRVLPAKNVAGQHGKTAAFIGFDEIHAYKDHALLEALAPDPTRYCLTWITSYDSLLDFEGAPLHDLKKIGVSGTDPGMLFSWYSADLCTDPDFAHLPPDERANPSWGSWPEGLDYLARQRRRLPSARFRRLHHNLPGAPQGAFFDQGIVERAIIAGRQSLGPQEGIDYAAFCDMSGGSSDDATLAIAHWDGRKVIIDLVIDQGEAIPFNPRLAVARFAVACARYRVKTVHGDAYAGETFRRDFADCKIDYVVCKQTRTDLYENLEVALNADQVELPDSAKLRQQLLTLVRRGASIDHPSGQHDDWATSAAGAVTLACPDLGAPVPAMLVHYERMVEAATTPPPVTDTVRIVWPRDQQSPSNLEISRYGEIAGGTYLVGVENGELGFNLTRDHARVLLKSPFSRADLIAANQEIAAGLEPLPREPSISVVGMLHAMRPQSIGEYALEVHAARGRETRKTLDMLRAGGWR
ncbi:hypothetical protein [Bradyrhizobium japonicum]|uniref:hypothetical protein n=1 Tax=Bradyrhizobium japonicum TaxID=375 RepID=UPI001E6271E1|nr:hypothetical protein [Bradyrhizobium japonicum]WRI87275.1 hypothetical protein R3F75_35740 [Bradyrhizobium japonicum]WRJ81797.1 hypothetical protein R3F78_38055 [Bradyrhizobium japonicum]WRJ90405.1 hypothetical protein R3F77_33640 [Bradyrhizobium japonicum]WRK49274.1 hypothetical protein R3F73_14525 [Bradyrhizobium japonicum]